MEAIPGTMLGYGLFYLLGSRQEAAARGPSDDALPA